MKLSSILVLSLLLITLSQCLPLNKRDQKRDLAEDDAEEEQEVSGEVEETDAESSGNARAEVSSGNEEKEEKQNNKSEESNKDNKNEKTAAEEDKTENAEKYEDEEQADNGKTKPVQQRSQQKGKNLMENMMENNKLEAYSVTKGKAKQKVPADDSEEVNEENEGEDDSTDVDLDFKETGLDALSGSGDENLHLTLKQTYNKQYDNKDSPAFKILTGNFEKDMLAALGEGSEISDISFSEAEVEGNPKTTGKVRVNFKFTGNYDKLSKIIKSGSINGLLVVKNSLEGPMLDLKEEE